MDELSDDELHKFAKARVEFRRHAFSYVVINIFLIVVWYITSDEHALRNYWPGWVHLGWGLGLAFSAYNAYGPGFGRDAVRREEEKLRARRAQR